MNSVRTDDEVVEKVRLLIADHGAEWAESYDLFLDDNQTFDPYWMDGVDAIRDNTVEVISFGRDCMLRAGRGMEDALFGDDEECYSAIMDSLAIEMDQTVSDMMKGSRQ